MSFEKSIKIKVDLNSIGSMREALSDYRNLLIENKIFNDLTFSHCFNLEFLNLDGEQFVYEDIEKLGNEKIVKYFREYFQYAESNEYISEELLFAYALNYEELKHDIFETIKEIVKYARKVNDTSDMWVDDYNVFGLGGIYITANIYPEYSYMLGAYMIPYWDDEHAPYAISLLEDFARIKGICRETLKLFCYCDGSLKHNLFGERYKWNYEVEDYEKKPDFIEPKDWFSENKEEYEWFKNTLKERFAEYSYLQFSESDFVAHPIDEFYKALVDIREDYDGFSDFFVYDSADMEAQNLEEEIIEYLGSPLVEEPEEEEDDYYHYGEGIKEWKEFVKIYSNKNVWSYIERGGDKKVLAEVKGSDSIKLYKMFKESIFDLRKIVMYHVGEFDLLKDELSYIVMNIFYDWYDENEAKDLDNIEHLPLKNARLLRLIDFLHSLFSYEEFSPSFVSFITDEYELMTEDEFYERYSTSVEGRIEIIIKKYLEFNICPYGSELAKIYKNFEDLRTTDEEKTIKLMEKYLDIALMFEFYPSGRESRLNSKWLLFMAYFLARDIEEGRKDKVTICVNDYLNSNFIKYILENIKEYSVENWKFGELENKFSVEEKVPQISKELMIKVMKEGPAALSQEELKEFEAFREANKKLSPMAKDIDLSELLDSVLSSSEFQWKKGKFYTILSENEMRFYLQAIYLLAQAEYKVMRPVINASFVSKAKLILNAFIKIAPLMTLNQLAKLWMSNATFAFEDEHLGTIDFMESLKRIKTDEIHIAAWDIFYSEDNNDIERIIDILGDIDEEAESSFFGKIEKNKRENYYKGLAYLEQSKRIEILEGVEEKYPIKTTLEKEMNEIIDAYIDKLVLSQSKILFKDNSYEGSIFNDTLDKYQGDNFGIESPIASAKVKNIFMTRENDDSFGMVVVKEFEGYKVYGDTYLVDMLNNRDFYEHYWFYNIKLVVTENLGIYTDRDVIKNAIKDYLQNSVSFESLEVYLPYMKNFVCDIDGTYQMQELIAKLGDDIRYRWIKLLIKLNYYRIDEFMALSVEGDIDRLIKYLEIFKELGRSSDNFIIEILEKCDENEINYLVENIDIVKIISKENSERKLEILERLGEEFGQVEVLSKFVNDKSRLVRDLVEEYVN
jgi:hypothetical protein